MTDPLSSFSKVLDPEWAARYIDLLTRLNDVVKENGSAGWQALIEIDAKRIEAESKARIEEMEAAHVFRMKEIQRDHDLAMSRLELRSLRPWYRRLGFDQLAMLIALLGSLALLALSLLKGSP